MTDNIHEIHTAVATAPKAKRSTKPKEPAGDKPKPPRPQRAGGEVPYDTSFPEDCPVEPLGINGDDVFFLDQKRQLRVLKAEKLNQGTIRTLFGDAGDLKYTYWPRYSKPDDKGLYYLVGWRPEQAADVLYNEAARRGIWDVFDRVRGPGGWQDEDGKLVMHCGDLVYHDGTALTPGQIGRHVYPSAPAKPHPLSEKVTGAHADELLAILKTWEWRRPEVDPYLLLGWMAAAMLGGALKWRPLVWITGDKATGKSTLHDVMKAIMGPGGLVSSTDASAAGLWQTVGHASLPVALDEIEAEEDNRKAQNIIKLARQAASGGQTLRGGSDHKNASFTVRSCFMFSSILIPPMLGQDVSRMAVLQLDKLSSALPPTLDPKHMERIGAALRARLIQQWPRLQGLMHTWKATLAKAGHSGRSADQFGTLLACCDLLRLDELPHHDSLSMWSELLDRSKLAECEDDSADHERCTSFLLSSQMDFFRHGERRTIGSWIQQAAGRDKGRNTEPEIDDARRALGNIGLKIMYLPMPSGSPGTWQVLLIANDHQGLSAVFKDSHWAGRSGANGVWVQAFRRIKGNYPDQQRFNGEKKRCTAVPLDEILGGDDA